MKNMHTSNLSVYFFKNKPTGPHEVGFVIARTYVPKEGGGGVLERGLITKTDFHTGDFLERGLIESGGGGRLIEFLWYFVSLVQTHNDLAIPYAEHNKKTFFFYIACVLLLFLLLM